MELFQVAKYLHLNWDTDKVAIDHRSTTSGSIIPEMLFNGKERTTLME